MNSYLILVWSVLSLIPGAGFLVAARSLWSIRKQPGSLLPFLFCITNGLYDVAFGVLLLLALIREAGHNNWDLLALWFILYLPARLSSMGLALLLTGQMNEDWLRKFFRI